MCIHIYIYIHTSDRFVVLSFTSMFNVETNCQDSRLMLEVLKSVTFTKSRQNGNRPEIGKMEISREIGKMEVLKHRGSLFRL